MSGNILKPLDKFTQSPLINKATIKGEAAFESGEKANLAVPIRVGGNIVGVIDIHLPQEHEWDPDEIDIVEAVADRLSLALESATLLQVTQRRAEIERLTADISGKISATTQFDSILRTAAEELSQVLGGSEVLVQIQTEALAIQTTPDTQSSGAML
jgi:GAF domain-containing protein